MSLLLLLAWATEGRLHNFDTTSTTYAGLVCLLLPGIGVMTWKDVQSRIPWGTVIVFGVGISLGTVYLLSLLFAPHGALRHQRPASSHLQA